MTLLNDYLRSVYGCKVYKLALSADVTCPNRDGVLSDKGCSFCSAGGSGEFAGDRSIPIADQLAEARKRVSGKIRDGKYIAYFQSFSNTYAPLPYLKSIYYEAIKPEDVVILSVGTRPDCLGDDVIALLSGINRIKPVWVELGLQTIHEPTAQRINRCYPLSTYDDAVSRLHRAGIAVVTHVILGLPGETEAMMLETVKYVAASGVFGIKLQLLQILKGTAMAAEYEKGKVPVMTLSEYAALLKKAVALIPEDMVIHRLTGDGPKSLLIAPSWSGDKKRVLNTLKKALPSILP
ncbi:MAG TPA: TIGR01212 family radical SAM protein [Lachnospiraceae bacterium]|nr:TIGR01212 family radical SAM protein [Lachnospiraceae bacterium]